MIVSVGPPDEPEFQKATMTVHSNNSLYSPEAFFLVRPGDVNGDGIVSAVDGLEALQIAALLVEPSGIAWAVGNVEGSEEPEITAQDGLTILQMAAGLVSPMAGQGAAPKLARWLQPNVEFQPGVVERLYWFQFNAPGSILLAGDSQIEFSVLTQAGVPAGGNEVQVFEQDEFSPQARQIYFPEPQGIYFIKFTRPRDGIGKTSGLELAVRYDDPESVFNAENLEIGPVLNSPLVEFPSGEPANRLPPLSAYDSFAEFVLREYGKDFQPGIPLILYVALQELAQTVCPAGATTTTTAPTTPDPTPIHGYPPKHASHNNNYCGISMFINSMETNFPGSLPSDVRTNPDQWDRVGKNLDHSNTIGEKGNKFVERVNRRYRDRTWAANGKNYCAAELDDTSPANLAAWSECCNLSLLVYDLVTVFGHWVDVTKVNGDELTLQDYDKNYKVKYDGPNENVDFSTAPTDSAMGDHFRKRPFSKAIAGDGLFEIVDFYVVCGCDISSGKKEMPKTTKSGKRLKP